MREVTLCLLRRKRLRRQVESEQILLGYKKKGFGVGKYTGVGGGLEEGETILQCAVRELAEELEITVNEQDLVPHGKLIFRFPAKPSWNMDAHLFAIWEWEGELQETDEIRPIWFDVTALPYDNMWDDGPFWLPLLLRGKQFEATLTFAEDNASVAAANVKVMSGNPPEVG